MRLKKILAINGAVIIILIIAIVSFQNFNKDKADSKNQTSTEESNIAFKATEQTGTEEENTQDTAEFSISTTEITENTKTEVNDLIKKYYTQNGEENADILLEETIEETAESTVESTEETKDSDQKKREIIESYKNLKTYIKPGLDNDSYVVFTTYNIKFKNIDTLVPGMSVLYVKKDTSGELRISSNLDEDNLNNYISQLSDEQDIKDVIETINTKLDNAIKKDSTLKKFIDYIS